jgi:glycosyltransferase involved in cell wall biosynthesis
MNDTITPKVIAVLLGWIVRLFANRIVVAAEAVARHYGLLGAKHTVLYAPVDIERYKEVNLSETKKKNRTPKIALVANWTRIKGVEYFVRAAALVKEMFGPVELHFAGARLATQREYCEKIDHLIHELGLSSNVVEHGFVQSVEDLMMELDVLVLSSTVEACPMVVLEGMAAGIPVVATDVGGVRELLQPDAAEPAGIVVPVRDAKAMSIAIIQLLKDKEKSISLGNNGRCLAKQRFSLETCANLHFEIYDAVS